MRLDTIRAIDLSALGMARQPVPTNVRLRVVRLALVKNTLFNVSAVLADKGQLEEVAREQHMFATRLCHRSLTVWTKDVNRLDHGRYPQFSV